jgi:epoxyqueuosine reductase QueG
MTGLVDSASRFGMRTRVEKIVLSLSADLVGVASVDRFKDAPAGFHPKDIYAKTESVIVFAIRVPGEALFAESPIPYTYFNNLSIQKADLLTFDIARALEREGIFTVPVPSDEPLEYWDSEQQRAQGILSMRHAGVLAGLGKLGRNSLTEQER